MTMNHKQDSKTQPPVLRILGTRGVPAAGRSIAAMRMAAMALLSDGYTIDAVALLEESKKSLESQQPAAGWAIFENNLLARIEQKILDQRSPAKPAEERELEPAQSALQFGQLIRRTAM